jgi:hypothetical protein
MADYPSVLSIREFVCYWWNRIQMGETLSFASPAWGYCGDFRRSLVEGRWVCRKSFNRSMPALWLKNTILAKVPCILLLRSALPMVWLDYLGHSMPDYLHFYICRL